MKKFLSVLLVAVLLLTLTGCGHEMRTGKENYQYIYDVFHDWNKSMTGGFENLYGYGEYLYNSYLALFPRETPSTLDEFYFEWSASMDVDYWAIYFTCVLTEENFNAFAEGLANFTVTTEAGSRSLLYDTEHFTLPTYIVQWLAEGRKWEVLEYIMLDEENHTAVFVYTMGYLDKIEENSKYTVTPISSPQKMADEAGNALGVVTYFRGYSVYDDFDNLVGDDGGDVGILKDCRDFESATYDLSFLEYLM